MRKPRIGEKSKLYEMIEKAIKPYEIPSIGNSHLNNLIFNSLPSSLKSMRNQQSDHLDSSENNFKIEELTYIFARYFASDPNLKPNSIINFDLNTSIEIRNFWFNHRRKEILELFKKFVYGRMPERPKTTPFIIREQGKWYNNDNYWRKQIRISLDGQTSDLDKDFKLSLDKHEKNKTNLKKGIPNSLLKQLKKRPHFVDILIVLPKHPNNITKPAPAFLGLNFFGNHTITKDQTYSYQLHSQKITLNLKLRIISPRPSPEVLENIDGQLR